MEGQSSAFGPQNGLISDFGQDKWPALNPAETSESQTVVHLDLDGALRESGKNKSLATFKPINSRTIT